MAGPDRLGVDSRLLDSGEGRGPQWMGIMDSYLSAALPPAHPPAYGQSPASDISLICSSEQTSESGVQGAHRHFLG